MNRLQIEKLVERIQRMPQFSGWTFTVEAADSYHEELHDIDVAPDVAWQAVRVLLYENDARFPTAQALRRVFLDALGILAPSWPAAQASINAYVEAYAIGAAELPDLAPPVREALAARGGPASVRSGEGNDTALHAQLRDTYLDCARRHDLSCMAPGGVARWQEARQAEMDRRALIALRQRAFEACAVLGLDERPAPDTPAENLQRLVDRAERQLGMRIDDLADEPAEPRDVEALIVGRFDRMVLPKGGDRG